ncbi:MAG TPA: formate/nitrite transporter family protein [Thermodesulfobacteriota bacterium]
MARAHKRPGAGAPEAPAPSIGEAVAERLAEKTEASRLAGRPKQLLLAFAGGAYVAFGVAFAVAVSNGIPWDGIQRLLFGVAFAAGFIMVFIGEGLLATELHVSMPFVVFRNRATARQVARDVGFWALVYVGNAVGTLFVAYLLSASQTFHGEPMARLTAKVMEGLRYEELGPYGWYACVLHGIAGNWLVGLAAFIAESSPTTAGKVIGVVFPVATFEALGFQHLTSSMAFFHTGILSGVPVGYGEFLAWNLAPTTLGNVIGGAVFVGFLYRYTHVLEAGRERSGVAR